MKILYLCLLLVGATAYSYDPFIEDIYKKASYLVENNDSDRDDDELLFEYYSNEIAKLDSETLKQNPELIFRRALAGFEVLDFTGNIIIEFEAIQKDLHFVLDHAEKDSRLHTAARVKCDFVDAILGYHPKDHMELIQACNSYQEHTLRQWATSPHSTGRELREEILLNAYKNPAIAQAIEEHALLWLFDEAILLGKAKRSQGGITGIETDEEGNTYLLYKVKYKVPHGTHTIEMHL